MYEVTQRQADRRLDILDHTADDFPFGDALDTVRRGLAATWTGRGVAVIRGLPADRLDDDAFQLLTWAIGLHFGTAVPQGRRSQYISAVRDEGATYKSPTGRGYPSRAALDFHTDCSDVVMLCCKRRAKSGGETSISSSVRMHNLMVAEQPALAATLYRNFWYSRQGEEAADEEPVFPISIFGERDDRLFVRYARKNITYAQDKPGVPPLTDEQTAALDQLDALAVRPDVRFSFYLEPGDLQILDNYAVMHARTEFVDHDAPDQRRLLYRLWLSVPDSHPLPHGWESFFRTTEAGAIRGGIRGQAYGEASRRFERRQAASLGMSYTS